MYLYSVFKIQVNMHVLFTPTIKTQGRRTEPILIFIYISNITYVKMYVVF